MKSDLPRIMLAAPASGSGKTALTTGLLQALINRGLKPAAFKCGPDYIDPMFHRNVLNVPGRNLDLFFTSPEIVQGIFRQGSEGADISVMEGAMGYYDGVGGTDQASGWQVASKTRTPAVLVLRPKGTLLTLAAMVDGLLRFRTDSMIRGIILNRCGDSYARKLTPVLERETGLQVYGHVPELPDALAESRHLGLITPEEVAGLRERIGRLADEMEKSVDVAGLVALAETAPNVTAALPRQRLVDGAPVRIAVALDAAFCFYYQENLELLRAFGAEPAFFSPLEDAHLPDGTHGLYLGGGYPELHADRLAANSSMRSQIRQAVESGLPTVAECGGFLYLQSRLADPNGREHAMAGVFDGTGRNAGRLRRFGYVRLQAQRDNLLCEAGEEIPAHEFHYWDCDDAGDSFVATKASGEDSWRCVAATETLFAGFPHLYFWSNPSLARRFVQAAIRRRDN